MFSHGSTNYHPLKATTINDPHLVTPELSNNSTDFDLMVATMTNEARPVSSELYNHHFIEKTAHLY